MHDICIIVESDQTKISVSLPDHALKLIKGLPKISFSLITISHKYQSSDTLALELPPNIKSLVNISLDETISAPAVTHPRELKDAFWQIIYTFYKAPLRKKLKLFQRIIEGLALEERRVLNMKDIINSPEAWDFMVTQYNRNFRDVSLLDYIWIFQLIQLPFLQLMNMRLPKAKVYHAFSIGYAGCAGLIARRKYNMPLIIDEQKKYLMTPLSQDNFPILKMQSSVPGFALHSLATLTSLYSASIKTLRYLCYHTADKIVINPLASNNSLYVKKLNNIVIIPQYVQIEEKRKHPKSLKKTSGLLIGLAGRITAANQIKSFIRACKLIALELSKVVFKLISLGKEDMAYLDECRQLINILDLSLKIQIGDKSYMDKYGAALNVLVCYDSKGENKDIILKAMSFGIPLIATAQYGNLLLGYNDRDIEMGAAGFIIENKNPEYIARKVLTILQHRELRKKMAQTAKKRIRRFYSQETCFQGYLKLYQNYL